MENHLLHQLAMTGVYGDEASSNLFEFDPPEWPIAHYETTRH